MMCQTDTADINQVELKQTGTQTHNNDGQWNIKISKKQALLTHDEIVAGLDSATSTEEKTTLITRGWHESAYRSTIDEGNPLTEDEGDLVIFVKKEDPCMSTGLPKIFKERYPELENVLPDEEYAAVSNVSTLTIKGKTQIKTRTDTSN